MANSSISESPEIFPDFKFNIDDLKKWITTNNFKSVALQVPEGLKRGAANFIGNLELELNISFILLVDPCFGACDLSQTQLETLGVDSIIHLGHSEIPNCNQPNIPIKYIELQYKVNPTSLISQQENMELIKTEFVSGSKIGLLASVQFVGYLDEIRSLLEKEQLTIDIGTGDQRLKYPGQVLGCNFSAAVSASDKFSGFIFIGDGVFHPLGVSIATSKKVLAFDPISNKLQNMDGLKDKILRQRSAAIAIAKEVNNFGIIVSTKSGQNRLEYAKTIKEKLIQHNRMGTLLAMDNVSPEQLDYLPFDAFINTACPRLTIDDQQRFKKVLITPIELEIVLGERDWENYKFDEIH
jgi:2-(3-amino-3-carboxypropyl)histidine synthase